MYADLALVEGWFAASGDRPTGGSAADQGVHPPTKRQLDPIDTVSWEAGGWRRQFGAFRHGVVPMRRNQAAATGKVFR